ncbi:MAG: hypothetical protein KIT32_12055 [Rhodocyclaceae bacterium]|nr:hypothetical protein [Rhodocyclaceae bacterium]
MSWERATAVGKRAVQQRIMISFHLSNGCISMRLTLGRGIMKMMGWDHGDRVAIYWGENKDFGWLRLEPDGEGFKLGMTTRKYREAASVIQTTEIHRAAILEPHFATECKWRVREGCLEIEAPKWLWVSKKKLSPTATANVKANCALEQVAAE